MCVFILLFFFKLEQVLYARICRGVCVCSKLSDQLQSHCNEKPMCSAFNYFLSNLHSFHLKNIPNTCIKKNEGEYRPLPFRDVVFLSLPIGKTKKTTVLL